MSDQRSTSRFRGVVWDEAMRRWKASIVRSGKRYTLGYFVRENEAAQAYDAGAARFFGELARSNATLGLCDRPKRAERGGAEPQAMDRREGVARAVGSTARWRSERASSFRSGREI